MCLKLAAYLQLVVALKHIGLGTGCQLQPGQPDISCSKATLRHAHGSVFRRPACVSRAYSVLVLLPVLVLFPATIWCTPLPGHPTATNPRHLVVNEWREFDGSELRGRTVRCKDGGILVRQQNLRIQDATIEGCSRAIQVIGPHAALSVSNVTFTDNNSTNSLGSIIWAQDATVHLHNVTISSNHNNLALEAKYHAPCTAVYGVTDNSSNNTSGSSPADGSRNSCGAPALESSLLHLERSTAVISASIISHNIANTIITAAGNSNHSVELVNGTVIANNMADWLLVADSWPYDATARANMLAPQPSEQNHTIIIQSRFSTADLMGGVRKSVQQGPQNSTAEVPRGAPWKYIGLAPIGQVPLRLHIQNASIVNNTVTTSLMWLRCVNTVLDGASITDNIAGTPRQRLDAGGSVPATGLREKVPPGPCEFEVLQRAMVLVHGPAAFDMNRCHISSNIHHTGALIRVTDGFGLTSIRNSTIVSNTATAVLRFEGRSWLLNWDNFIKALSFLDQDRLADIGGTDAQQYESGKWLHGKMQDLKEASSLDASWYMADSTLANNTLYHTLVQVTGGRTTYDKYQSFVAVADTRKAAGLQPDEKPPTLDNNSTAWWLVRCNISGNRLLGPQPAANQTLLNWQQESEDHCPKESARLAGKGADTTAAGQPGLARNTTESAQDVGSLALADWPVVLSNDTLYADAVAFVLTADAQTVRNLTQLVKTASGCHCQLRKALLAKQAGQEFVSNRAPAVLWTTFTNAYLANTSVTATTGFHHVLSAESAYVTMQAVQLVSNAVQGDLVNIMNADVAWRDGAMADNQVLDAGSLLRLASAVGLFWKIDVIQNIVGADSQVQLNRHSEPVAAAAASNKGGSGNHSAPLWSLTNIDNALFNGLRFANNNGSIALDVSMAHLDGPVQDVIIADNGASGVRMTYFKPRFDNASVSFSNVVITGNMLTSSEVGALTLGGFGSGVGERMPVSISDSIIANNKPKEGSCVEEQLQGGGIKFNPPKDDEQTSEHAMLKYLTITMTNTTITGNVAAEGGGIWSVWPMQIDSCRISENRAIHAGGGMYLRGLMKNKLGTGHVVITNSTITNNTAGFGGGIACDSCRVISNAAIRNNSAADAPLQSSSSGLRAISNTSSSSSSAGNALSLCDTAEPVQLMADAPKWAGGGIAANFRNNTVSYLVLCGSKSSGRTSASLMFNRADYVGGAVYANSTQPQAASQCGQAACGLCKDSSQWATAEAGLSGVVLYDVPVSNSSAMLAQYLQATKGSKSGGMDSTTATESEGFSACSCSRSAADAASDTCSSECQPGYNFTLAEVFTPGQLAGLKLHVYDTLCLDQLSKLLSANKTVGLDLQVAQCSLESTGVYNLSAGHNMSLTVSLGALQDLQQNSSNSSSSALPSQSSSTALGQIQLLGGASSSQCPEEYVIGRPYQDIAQDHRGSIAEFRDLIIQPVEDPVKNVRCQLEFRLNSSMVFMNQLPPASAVLNVQRCSLGQHMAIRRCIDCRNTTYSLHPNFTCLACPEGGNCTRGLLYPDKFYFSFNPLVPQLLDCPMKPGCGASKSAGGNSQAAPGNVNWTVNAVRKLVASAIQGAHSSDGSVWGLHSGNGLLTQGAAAAAIAALAQPNSDSSLAAYQSDDENRPLSRAEALFLFHFLLADVISNSNTSELMLHLNYTQLMLNWHQLQCMTGYTGRFCASCDVEAGYGLFLNSCVECKTRAVSWATFIGLYLAFCVYLAAGIVMQLRAPQLGGSVSMGTASALPTSVIASQLQESKSVDVGQPQEPTAAAAAPLAADQQGTAVIASVPALQHAMLRITQPEEPVTEVTAGSLDAELELGQQLSSPTPFSDPRQRPLSISLDKSVSMHSSELQQRQEQRRQVAHGSSAGKDTAQTADAAGSIRVQGSVSSPLLSPAAALPTSMTFSVNMDTPRSLFVAIWKVFTSYVQVLAMVRYLRVPLPKEIAQALTVADLSSFTALLSIDCLMYDAFTKASTTFYAHARVVFKAVILPILLIGTFAAGWITAWCACRAVRRLRQSHPGPGARRSLSSAASQAPDPCRVAPGSAAPGPWQKVLMRIQGCVQSAKKRVQQASFSTEAGLRKLGMWDPAGSLKGYIALRMLVTFVVVCYTCYPLVISSWMEGVTCRRFVVRGDGVAASTFAGNSASLSVAAAATGLADVLSYGSVQRDWLYTQQELHKLCAAANCSNATVIDTSMKAATARVRLQRLYGTNHSELVQEATRYCNLAAPTSKRPDLVPDDQLGSYCWVPDTVLLWNQDYSVRCFNKGPHTWMEGLGIAMLVLLGILLPAWVAVWLRRNKRRLRDWDFAMKYSFLYSEYHSKLCCWEAVITLRKGVFLALTFLLPMTPLASSAITQLQLVLGNMLALVFLVCQEFFRPYRSPLLNSLERLSLSAIALSYAMLASAVLVEANDEYQTERGRMIILICMMVANGLLMLWFIYQGAKQLWLIMGEKVGRCTRTTNRHLRTWLWRSTARVKRRLGFFPSVTVVWRRAAGHTTMSAV